MDSFDGDDLSTALGTETLAGREMVPEGTGFEYRSLDNGLYDKYWRCKYCH
jgi:hypothetical protein